MQHRTIRGNKCFDYARRDETQTFYPRLTSSPLGNGGSGPMLGDTTTVTPIPGTLELDYN